MWEVMLSTAMQHRELRPSSKGWHQINLPWLPGSIHGTAPTMINWLVDWLIDWFIYLLIDKGDPILQLPGHVDNTTTSIEIIQVIDFLAALYDNMPSTGQLKDIANEGEQLISFMVWGTGKISCFNWPIKLDENENICTEIWINLRCVDLTVFITSAKTARASQFPKGAHVLITSQNRSSNDVRYVRHLHVFFMI